MKRILVRGLNLAVLLLLVLVAVACGPEKLVQWSPDGKSAAVIVNGTLFLSNEQGDLSRPIAENVTRLSWLPDSAHALVVTGRKVKSWDELLRLAPVDLKEKEIISAAQAATEELLGYEGKIDDFEPSNAAALTGEQWAAALLYIRNQGDLRLKQKLGEKDWKELQDLDIEVRTLRVISITSDQAGEVQALLTTMEDIAEPRIAPDGASAAIVTGHTHGWFGPQDMVLSTISLSPGSLPVQVAKHVSEFPDWMPDGSGLAFIRRESEPTGNSAGDSIGIVTKQTLRGKAEAAKAEMPPPVDLAKVMFRENLKVRCLRDGRILFSAHEVSLPANVKEFPGRISLFEIQPGTAAAIKPLLPASTAQRLPDRADLYELSPNQKRIAVPGSKGRVSVISLDKGEVEPVLDADSSNDLLTIPVWRNDDQLCLAVPAGSSMGSMRRAEIVLWGAGQPRNISLHWSDSVVPWLK